MSPEGLRNNATSADIRERPRAAGAEGEMKGDIQRRRVVRGLARRGSALLIVSEPRAARAVAYLLEEFDYNVDAGVSVSEALDWLDRVYYDLIVAGGPDAAVPGYARALRRAAPGSRILLLAPEEAVPAADALRVDVIPPPVRGQRDRQPPRRLTRAARPPETAH